MLSCGARVIVCVRVWFADVFAAGIAGLTVCVTGYLLWLHFHEKLQQRREERDRRRRRLAHWGNE
jgi:uncharacterized protein (DUF2062 family)